jgi:hypothetical protein
MTAWTYPERTRPRLLRWERQEITLASHRRRLQVALGLIWLLDAVLQFQPYMFTRDFVTQTLASTAAGNPGIVAHPIVWASDLMAQHIVIYNAIFATIQLVLAFGLFWRPTVKIALGASIVWAIGVWWFGEGLGGVLTGGTSAYMGAPGAVILYAFIALLLWPRGDGGAGDGVALGGPLGALVPRVSWLALWGSFVSFTLQPGDRAPDSLSAMVAGMGNGEPSWIRVIDGTMAGGLDNHGAEVAIAVALVCAAVAVSPFFARTARPGVIAAVCLGAAIWLVQDFGGIFTGQATDPGSGVLLVLLAATFWPIRPPGWRHLHLRGHLIGSSGRPLAEQMGGQRGEDDEDRHRPAQCGGDRVLHRPRAQ